MKRGRVALLLLGGILGLVLLVLADRLLAPTDPEQAAICRRILPALHPGEALSIESLRRGAQARDILIRYAYSSAGQMVPAQVTCRFAGSGLDASRRDLVGLRTADGEVGDGTLYFLKRFWLGTAESVAFDPGMPPPWRAPQVAFAVAYGVQQALASLPSAAVYALLAAAYALVYGLTGRVMLGFGEVAALGSIAGVVSVATGLSGDLVTPVTAVIFAMLIATAAAGLHGYAAGHGVLWPLRRATGQQVLIATVGLALALTEYLRLAQGNETRWLPPVATAALPVAASGGFIASISLAALVMAALGLLVCGVLIQHLATSRFGRDWRAMADDPGMAGLMGVDAKAVFLRAIMIACALSALAGLIITVIFGGVGHSGGLAIGLKGLVAAVLGGLGSVRGAVLGGLAIAAIEAAWSAVLPIEHRDLVIFSLLAVVLIIRPGGFFGEAALTPRPV
jgi:branched-chain amino acid transport system permease protein